MPVTKLFKLFVSSRLLILVGHMQLGIYSFLLDLTVWKTSSKMFANPSEFIRI